MVWFLLGIKLKKQQQQLSYDSSLGIQCNSAESSLWLQITSYWISFPVTEGSFWPFSSPHLVSFSSSLSFSFILSPFIYPSVHNHPILRFPMGTYQSTDFSSSYCRCLSQRHRKSIPQKLVVSIPAALSEIIRTFISIREHCSICDLLRQAFP